MANPLKGDIGFTVNGTEYTLRLTNNVRCELDKMLGEGLLAVLSRWAEAKWTDTELRTIFWGALKTRHPRITPQEAGDLIDEAGSAAVAGAISEAFMASQPKPRGDEPNPQRGSGTGPGP
jgi:hypothetical protein